MEIILASKEHRQYDEKLDFPFWKVFNIFQLEGSVEVMLGKDF